MNGLFKVMTQTHNIGSGEESNTSAVKNILITSILGFIHIFSLYWPSNYKFIDASLQHYHPIIVNSTIYARESNE